MCGRHLNTAVSEREIFLSLHNNEAFLSTEEKREREKEDVDNFRSNHKMETNYPEKLSLTT